jgi:hypothetical protein
MVLGVVPIVAEIQSSSFFGARLASRRATSIDLAL